MKRKKQNEGGWTFLETLIVITIIFLLPGSIGFVGKKYIDSARIATAKNEISILMIALDSYYIDCKKYPTEQQGLKALWEKPVSAPIPNGWNGPYVTKDDFVDPWDFEYVYHNPGPENVPIEIITYGSDNTPGGEKNDEDITSWKM